MKFVCYADWDSVPDSANILFSQAAQDSIFLSRPWFENLVNTFFEDHQSLLLACVIEEDIVLAILPLDKRGNEHFSALTHLYSSLFTLLLAKQNQAEIIQCLVRGLTQIPLVSLRLAPIAKDDGNMQMLQQAMEQEGFECHLKYRFYNWIHHLQGQSFKQYLAARPSRVRNTIARKQRKLEREHGYTIRLFTDQNLQQGLADYNAVYKASWKAHEQFDGFISDLARTLSRLGWLRLAVLYIDEKPAAAQFWFVVYKKASIFKLAYDDAWKQYSPGSILISYLMEYVIDTDNVEEIDFLTGNDAYKQDWMSQRRERWGLYCGKPSRPEGRIDRIADLFKRLTRPLIGKHVTDKQD